ncbi:MAG TPA: hypothetical protein DCQ36_05580 [Actinobacteria bacterium]|jgi:hypothetical protein|nr:hypothetical protein [Actinomycetota bacterium]
MADDDIEIGEDIEVDIVLDADGNPIGAVVDDLVVASGPQGSIVDETIDVLDAEGNLLLEDEKVSVYDAEANLVAQEETITLALDSADEA